MRALTTHSRLTCALIALAVVAVFAIGAWLRLDAIGASLWLDEFGTLWVVEGGFATLLSRAWQFQGQSPLYYVLPWLSIHGLGESELALRLPSLLLGVALPVVMYAGARVIAGPRAALWSAALSWCAVPAVRASVEARPYGLVLVCAAVAVTGFAWTVRSGERPARALWILGGASVAWSHYVHYPLVLGLCAAYAMLPALRQRYAVRTFLTDAALQATLVAATLPQVLSLLARQGTLSWLDEWNYLAFLGPLVPLVPAIAIGALTGDPRRDTPLNAALRHSLIICLLTQVAVLEVAALAGTNLLTARYFMATFIPAALLAAAALARSPMVESTIAVLAFAFVTGQAFVVTKRGVGSFSGIGDERWRAAVADLSTRVDHEPRPLVLYRSGFVEEDVQPLGTPVPATRAPLRSPGRPPFAAPVTSLTFRWNSAARQEYFARTIAPLVGSASRFILLARIWTPDGTSYPDRFVGWVEDTWPARFVVERHTYGGVELLEFRAPAPD